MPLWIGREHAPGLVLTSAFALGSLFMYGLKLWTMRLEHQRSATTTAAGLITGLLLATFIDLTTDGFIIGAGFAAGGETGTILALGLSVELLFLGLALASEATAGWRIIAISGSLGGTVMIFSLIGNVLLTGASHAVIGGALAFSTAALLYLVTEELLMEAHEVEEKPISTLVLFGGFLSFWSIQLLNLRVIRLLRLLYKFRFQLHCTNTINLAVNIMGAFDETDAFYLGSNFNYR